jgi:sucrose-6-phosphate hydrolase SacC (GH32 family)
MAEIELRDPKAFGLRLLAPAIGPGGITIRCDATHLDVGGTRVLLPRRADQPTMKLHSFLDRSLVEVYADDGRIAVSRAFTPDRQSDRVEFFSEGGSATLTTLDAWPIKTIW